MRRWLFAGCFLVVLGIAAVYFFIPSKLVVSKIVLVKCNPDGADRVLGDTGHWMRWWPRGGPGLGKEGSDRGGVGFEANERLLKAVGIEIHHKEVELTSRLTVYALINKDSCFLQWEFKLNASLDPLKRIGQYREASRLKDSMSVVMSSLKDYLEKKENVYGLTIHEGMVPGGVLEEGSWMLRNYPVTDTIYQKVRILEQFIAAHGQPVTGHPMVNVTPLTSGLFHLRVALPTDKEIPGSANIQPRNLPTDNFLYADVRGGEGTVHAAFGRMDDYISDYGRTKMAIPFLVFVTDRRTEPDTAKWTTRIYYPIL
jgi:hypothetical protein